MNTIDLEKFEQDLYLEEKEEFLSNKCSDCMSYLNEETEECDNNFCIGKIPEEYRQQQPTPPPPTEINRGIWWYKLKQLTMQDLHKQKFLDAQLELGTQVQFFSFTLTQLCSYSMVLAIITVLLLNLIPTYYSEILSLYTGSFITFVIFYIKWGTN